MYTVLFGDCRCRGVEREGGDEAPKVDFMVVQES